MQVQKKDKTTSEFVRATVLLAVLLLLAVGVLWWIGKQGSRETWWTQAPAESSEATPPTAAPPPAKRRSSSEMKVPPLEKTDRRAKAQAGAGTGTGTGEPVTAEAVQTAMEMIDKGQWREAEAVLLEYLKQNPRDEMALVEMSMIQVLDRKDAFAALPYLQQAIVVNPQNEIVMEEMLRAFEETRNWEGGLDFLQNHVPNENGSLVNYGIGTALLELNRPAEAVEVLQKAVYENGVTNFDTRDTLAQSYLENGQTDQALEEYRTILQGPYTSTELHYTKLRYASALIDAGQTAEARQILQQEDPSDELVSTLLKQMNDTQF